MAKKCAAINCRSIYAKEKKDSNITFHYFPFNDAKLLKHWLKQITRKIGSGAESALSVFLCPL